MNSPEFSMQNNTSWSSVKTRHGIATIGDLLSPQGTKLGRGRGVPSVPYTYPAYEQTNFLSNSSHFIDRKK